MTELLKIEGLSKDFPITAGLLKSQVGAVHAVDDVSLTLNKGETLGIVGESGCGKSTLARAVIRLHEPTQGKVFFKGEDFTGLDKQRLKKARRGMQMIFQDPYASLNPRMSVGKILEEPFKLHDIGTPAERTGWARELLQQVGLRADAMARYPHEFSGGQRQRIGVARALALKPELIICDEAVSALDVSVQSQVLNLLVELQRELGLSYLFISHDLAVVKYISDRVAVMYLGRVVELATNAALFKDPRHPYTRALLTALPVPDPGGRDDSETLAGDVPSPSDPPSGCHFHTRCKHVEDRCKQEAPALTPFQGDADQLVACHRAEELEPDVTLARLMRRESGAAPAAQGASL